MALRTIAILCSALFADRPDLKQLVWILTVSNDGAVPITYRLADGNTSDDPTHIPTWDGLTDLLGRTDFLYVADSKLCSREAMGHINGRGGRFVTVLPRSRSEDKAFREYVQNHTPDWVRATVSSGRHPDEPDEVYSVASAPAPSAEGYRIVWVHSTTKAARDAATRQARTEAGIGAIEALEAKLSGPRCRIKTRVAAEKAATTALANAYAERWVTATITEQINRTYQQEHGGRPGPGTRYREITTSRFSVTADINLEHISNDRDLTNAQILAAYKYQPNLERRHHLLKSVQNAAPVLLRDPARIEALFCCQFLALHQRPHRTRSPQRYAPSRHQHDRPLPRVPRMRSPVHRTDPGNLRRNQSAPPLPPRPPRQDIRTRTHRPTTTAPEPPRFGTKDLHRPNATPVNIEISLTRSAESQVQQVPHTSLDKIDCGCQYSVMMWSRP